jgi:hypothetical protein
MDAVTRLISEADFSVLLEAITLERIGWSAERVRSTLETKSPEDLAVLFAWLAAYHGADDVHWRRWFSLLEAVGLSAPDVLPTLDDQELRCLGRWGVQTADKRDIGLAAYAAFLQGEFRYGPFEGENVEYLCALVESGRQGEVEPAVDLIRRIRGRCPLEEQVLAWARAREDDAEARERLRAVARDIDRPADHRSLAAYLSYRLDGQREWADILATVLRRHAIWKLWRARFRQIPDSLGIEVPDAIVAEPTPKGQEQGPPKYVIEPSDGDALTFAEGGWQVPACRGCGHSIHVWFSLRPNAIPELAKWLPWDRAPLLSCADCGFWMGSHRYQLHPAERRLELLETELDGDAKSATAHSTTPTSRPRPAALRKVTAGAWKKLFDKREPSVVAGRPPRLRDYSWPRCRGCLAWMKYYGALGESDGFDHPTLLNGAGFLLHFACTSCARITVVPNWT